jgi:hypothetical protein
MSDALVSGMVSVLNGYLVAADVTRWWDELQR